MSKGPAEKNCVGNTDVSYDRKSTPPRQISRPSVQGWGMGPKILRYKRVAPAHPLYDIFFQIFRDYGDPFVGHVQKIWGDSIKRFQR